MDEKLTSEGPTFVPSVPQITQNILCSYSLKESIFNASICRKRMSSVKCLPVIFLVLCNPFTHLSFAKGFKTDSIQTLYVEGNFSGGFIYKHTSNMIADVSGLTPTWELGIFRQTNGSKYWHSKLNYPSYGVSLYQQINPNRDTLGITTSILPSIRFVWWRNHRWEGFFGLGTGLAFASKKYDAETNTNNNLMGSHWNVHV